MKNNHDLAAHLEHRLRPHRAIQAVAANEFTGNITISYDASLNAGDVLGLIDTARMIGEDRLSGQVAEAWWAESTDAVMLLLGSSARGLPTEEVARRHKEVGYNALSENPATGEWQILLRQLNSLPVWLLGASAVVSLAGGLLIDAALVAGVVAANVAIGFFTDRQAERILQQFVQQDRSAVVLRRDGNPMEVPADEVVPGDIMMLPAGSVVAADARILSSIELQVDESMLTGESLPVPKSPAVIARSVALPDRTNMLYAGTVIVSGSAVAVVVATGAETEIGRIQSLVAATPRVETPMHRQLDRLGTHLTFASLAASGLMLGLGFLHGVPLATLIRTSTALAVAAIPEGLPTVATSILAMGLREMQRNKVLIRQLAAVETLGSVNVICFDKTGTLTQNRMTATQARTPDGDFDIRDGMFFRQEEQIDPLDHTALHELLLVAALCNETEVHSKDGGPNHVLNGSSTESALIVAAISAGIDIAALRREYPLVENIQRNGKRRYMMTIHRTLDHRCLVAAKGDPVDLLLLCTHARSPEGDVVALTDTDRNFIHNRNEAMTSDGLRVLGFASVEHNPEQPLPPKNLVWLGMIGMADPLRRNIADVLGSFHDAGIRTVMVTGDQAGTASAIARDAGLSPTMNVIDGLRFLQGSAQEVAEHAGEYDVFSRVSPTHKLDIVQALQKSGLTVAMAGDGTNDAPALRAADIGVAMGRHGTTAAREIADIVLAEDDIGTMVVAVRQGRTIYANMRKAIHFLVSTNSSEVFVTLGAAACGLGQPLNAGQLLWLNLVTDVAIAYALGLEPVEYDVMQHPPRPREENIIRPSDYRRLALKSGLFSVSALTTHIYGMARYGASGGGIAFSTLIGAQLLDGLSSRSETRPPWVLPQNRALTLAIAGTAALQGVASVIPFSRQLLGLAAFDLLDLVVIAAGSLWPFLLVETVIKPNVTDSSVRISWSN